MTFKTNMQSDIDTVILNKDEFAEEVGYIPWSGESSTITVTWEDTGIDEREVNLSFKKVATARVTASKTAVSTWDTRDKFTRGGATWAVETIPSHREQYIVFNVITYDTRYVGGKRIRGNE